MKLLHLTILKRIACVTIILSIAPVKALYANEGEKKYFDEIAVQLIGNLEKTDKWQSQTLLEWGVNTFWDAGNVSLPPGLSDFKKSVAVWPFDEGNIPVPKDVADRWTRLLENAIVRHKSSNLNVVTRNELATILKETEEFSLFNEVENPSVTLAKNAEVSALVIGDIQPYKGGFLLSFQAIEVQSGAIIAASDEYEFAADLYEGSLNQDILPLDAAIEDAANYFARSSLGLDAMEIYGVREANSEVYTVFGDFVTSHFTAELTDTLSQTIPDFKLKVTEKYVSAPEKTRGLTVEQIPLQPEDEYKYTLSGKYWVLGEQVNLSLSLANIKGETTSWKGKVQRATIPQELLSESETPVKIQKDDIGPIGLKITSSKGDNPSYKFGQNVVLWVETKRDAFLNCFYIQADGKGFKIFPNKYLVADLNVPNSQYGFMRAGEAVEIPGSYAGFKFTASAPAGVEQIHCFATDQNITNQLPAEIGQQSLTPISSEILNRLPNHYRNIPAVRISEATMTITVKEK